MHGMHVSKSDSLRCKLCYIKQQLNNMRTTLKAEEAKLVDSLNHVMGCEMLCEKLINEIGKEAIRKKFDERNRFLLLRRLVGLAVKPVGARYFAERIDGMGRKYDFDKCEYVACSMPIHYGARETIRREHMSRAVYLPFRDRTLPVPAGWDVYLTNLYGDYMTVPEGAEQAAYAHLGRQWNVEFEDD